MLLQTEEAHQAAVNDVREYQITSHLAEWASKNSKSSVGQQRLAEEKAVAEELEMARGIILKERKQKLRSLYKADWEEWQREFSMMGLALAQ